MTLLIHILNEIKLKISLLIRCKLFLRGNLYSEKLRVINIIRQRMFRMKYFGLVLVFCLFAFSNIQAQDAGKGENLYKINCASCHKVHEKLVGPALAGVYDKYEREWLYSWIKNSQAMVKAGDADAVAIYNEYNQQLMTAFPTLAAEDIDNILEYIRVETDKGPQVAVAGGTGGGDGGTVVEKGFGPSQIYLLVLTLALIAIAILLATVLRSLNNIIRERDGLDPLPNLTIDSLFRNRAFKIAAGLAVFGLLAYTTYDNAGALGRQEGYKPEQPIKFSHKLHAGQYGIDCQYCHSGAANGKSAVIPSTNVCMNCHKQVQEGPVYGKKEIEKIYKSVGFDPKTKKYKEGYEQEPIEWVRIHNLPDHVYFNHAQHVTAGQIECQTCHGEIQEMEVVEQHSSLGMGWCIDCHRKTNVQFAGNDYYSIYEKYHEEIRNGERTQVTVEDIGGLECQKCHY